MHRTPNTNWGLRSRTSNAIIFITLYYIILLYISIIITFILVFDIKLIIVLIYNNIITNIY